MVVGVADTTGKPATANVTFTTTAVPPFGVMVSVPVYAVDDAVKPLGFAVTVRLYGVVTAVVALVVSQLAELVTVKEIPDVPEVAFATTKVCAGGLVPPIVKAKLSGPAGVTVTLPPVPLAATTMLTLTVCTADAVVKLIEIGRANV